MRRITQGADAPSIGCLASVPCWIREMSDADAYMALALCNAQGELHPLEEGMHAIGSGLSVREYAERVGKSKTTMQHRIQAAGVMGACTHMGTVDLRDNWRSLSELHSAPRWLWRYGSDGHLAPGHQRTPGTGH